jgi:hypothetical protein
VWDLPFYKSSENWYLKNLLGNWQYTATYFYESPEFATVQSGLDSNLNSDSAGDRASVNLAGNPNKFSLLLVLARSTISRVSSPAIPEHSNWSAGLCSETPGTGNTINSFPARGQGLLEFLQQSDPLLHHPAVGFDLLWGVAGRTE